MVSIQNKFLYHSIYFTRPDLVMRHIECLPDYLPDFVIQAGVIQAGEAYRDVCSLSIN
jgi:hypothetical protein